MISNAITVACAVLWIERSSLCGPAFARGRSSIGNPSAMRCRRWNPRWDGRTNCPPSTSAKQVRCGAGLAFRQYRVRDRAGPDPVPVVVCNMRPSSGGRRPLRSPCAGPRWLCFNARLDAAEQPHKSAGFNTGVPAPAGAGLAFVPIFLWLITGHALFRSWPVVMAWTLVIAALMISSLRPIAGRRSEFDASGACSHWPELPCWARHC